MAFGKPVIATGWSGNTDFMNVSNSFPVSYRLVELDRNVGPYPAGDVWAEPSIEHAAELMRFVVDHSAEAKARGDEARRAIHRDYSEPQIAALMNQRLAVIAERDGLETFRRSVRALVSGYRDLVGEIRQVVERFVPAGGTVLVVSKGDDSLIRFEGRTGHHFPETATGVYAGFHPRDSAAAIELLETSAARGREYLLIPGTALWWLDYYDAFRSYLEARCERVWADPRCVLYRMHRSVPARPIA